MTKRFLRLVLYVLLLSACASTVKSVHRTVPLSATARWVLLPVANYAETPQAGERVEALLETVLHGEGVANLDRYPPLKEDDTHLIMSERQRYEESLGWARGQHYDYAVTGSVEEWRYKSGLDGDPAVGLTIRVVQPGNGRVLWSASGTRTGGGAGNVSGTALELLGILLDDLSLTR